MSTERVESKLYRCVSLLRAVAADIESTHPALARDIRETLDTVNLRATLENIGRTQPDACCHHDRWTTCPYGAVNL